MLKNGAAKEVRCWGWNVDENLGFGDTVTHQYPTKVIGLSAPSKVVSTQWRCGSYSCASACAIDGGKVRCWGSNQYGPTLHGPTLVTLTGGVAPLDSVADLQSGTGAYCALRGDNTLWCWGPGYVEHPVDYGVTNIAAQGWASDPRFLTTDGAYHIGGTTRAPNCGLLE